jgi:hypothetical protein
VNHAPLTLYQIAECERRFWRQYRTQRKRGRGHVSALRVAHAKLAPELGLLSEENRQSVLRSIELSQ